MTTRVEATAAPRTVKIGGKEYQAGSPTDKDYGEFEAWVQDRFIETTTRNLGNLTEKQAERQLDRVYEQAALITVGSKPYNAAACSLHGMVKLLFLCLRGKNPDLTEEDVATLLAKSPDNLIDGSNAVKKLVGVGLGSKKKLKRPKGAPRKRSKRKPVPRKKRSKK